jgi:hypothetical protein
VAARETIDSYEARRAHERHLGSPPQRGETITVVPLDSRTNTLRRAYGQPTDRVTVECPTCGSTLQTLPDETGNHYYLPNNFAYMRRLEQVVALVRLSRESRGAAEYARYQQQLTAALAALDEEQAIT